MTTIHWINHMRKAAQPTQNVIILHHGNPVTAEFRGLQEPFIRDLFKTNIITTPYVLAGDGCYAEELRITRAMQSRNPNCVVRWEK